MVLKRIFKSKEQRKKDKLKTDLKKKISNVGGGRSNQGTAKRLQRELKAVDAPKKVTKVGGGRISRSSQNMSGKNADGTRKGSTTTTNKSSNKKVVKKATMTAKERAQASAKARIAAKKAGTYKAPKTAQQLAKERIAKKKKK